MNNQGKISEDILRQYLAPDRAEQAPEGFTSKVMSQVHTEILHVPAAHSFVRRNLVPFIYTGVVILLTALVILVPGGKADSLTDPFLGLLLKIRSSMPDINVLSMLKLSLPSLVIYVTIGILFLSIFDRALYGIFHKAN